jgi:hypothetical protein
LIVSWPSQQEAPIWRPLILELPFGPAICSSRPPIVKIERTGNHSLFNSRPEPYSFVYKVVRKGFRGSRNMWRTRHYLYEQDLTNISASPHCSPTKMKANMRQRPAVKLPISILMLASVTQQQRFTLHFILHIQGEHGIGVATCVVRGET